MATKAAPNSNGTNNSTPPPAPNTDPLYEAFPEPLGWALNWDGAALQSAPQKPGTQPKQ